MQVIAQGDRTLGRLDHLLETGANDVMVVKGEREYLVPFIEGQVVKSVDLETREIRVDWDPDF
jgi:16S rRNA processing protein RimM